MTIEASSVEEYISNAPEERTVVLQKLRQVILDNLPDGFEETMLYKMPAYVVPHSIYPSGYHCKPTDPLPFINFASQKNFIALYNMGLYAEPSIYEWFTKEYPNHCKKKLNMGKSCVRFKYMDDIPFELIGQLVQKMNVQDWIKLYETNIKK